MCTPFGLVAMHVALSEGRIGEEWPQSILTTPSQNITRKARVAVVLIGAREYPLTAL